MIMDNFLVLSDAQAITVTATSTYYVDSLAAGSAINDELFIQFLIDTAFGGTSGTTLAMTLQTAQDSAFGTLVHNIVVANPILSALTPAGKVYNLKIPPVAGRYIRAYYTVTTSGGFTSGKIDARLVKDIDITTERQL